MLRYFPFTEKFDLKIGTSPLSQDQSLIECDEHYVKEIELKRRLLNEDHRYCFRAAEGTALAQWEVLTTVLENLLKAHPEKFILIKDQDKWHWKNKTLNEKHDFVFGELNTLPFDPLDWVGRQVQEDLIILDPSLTLVAGQLCFPSGWDLDEKFGKHFLNVHAPLPSLSNPMIDAANKFIERLPIGKTFQRNNWGFRASDQLDLSSRHSKDYQKLLHTTSAGLTEESVGETIFIRIEHQTLSRLLLSQHVLFTIHTYQNKISEEIKDKHRAQILLSFLNSVPAPLLEYKLMTPFMPVLLKYLESVV